MSPCATASPVDCIYSEIKTYQVTWTGVFISFTLPLLRNQDKTADRRHLEKKTLPKGKKKSSWMTKLECFSCFFYLNPSVPALLWWPCWLHPECGYRGSSRCPGSLEKNPAASPTLLCCRDRSARPALCTSSSSDDRQRVNFYILLKKHYTSLSHLNSFPETKTKGKQNKKCEEEWGLEFEELKHDFVMG